MNAWLAALGLCWLAWRPLAYLAALVAVTALPGAERARDRAPRRLAGALVDELAEVAVADVDGPAPAPPTRSSTR